VDKYHNPLAAEVDSVSKEKERKEEENREQLVTF
jgi:hypothetical protein